MGVGVGGEVEGLEHVGFVEAAKVVFATRGGNDEGLSVLIEQGGEEDFVPGLFEFVDHGGFVDEDGGIGLTTNGVGVYVEGPEGEFATGGEFEPVLGFAFGYDEGGKDGFEGAPLSLHHFVGGGEIGGGGAGF